MVRQVELQEAGDSLSVSLPREMTDRLGLQPGDRVFAIEMDGGVLLTTHDPDSHLAMQAFDEVRRQYTHTLRRLAG
jgi:putative addiction module antidote